MLFISWVVLHWRIALAVLGLILLALVLWWAKGAYTDYRQRKVANDLIEYNGRIANAQTQINALDDERERRKIEVNDAQANANKVLDNANRIRRTDSSQFNANASAVRSRFCTDYPDDSICR